MADAVAQLILDSGRAADPGLSEVVVFIDLESLLHGARAEGVSYLSGGQHLPVSAVRRLCCEARIIPMVLGGDGEPLDVGREHRTATRAQRRALRKLYQTCAHPQCEVRFDDCHVHHVDFWEHGGRTDLGRMLPLCARHHHLVHDGHWRLTLSADRTINLYRPDGVHHLTARWQTPEGEHPRTRSSKGTQADGDTDAARRVSPVEPRRPVSPTSAPVNDHGKCGTEPTKHDDGSSLVVPRPGRHPTTGWARQPLPAQPSRRRCRTPRNRGTAEPRHRPEPRHRRSRSTARNRGTARFRPSLARRWRLGSPQRLGPRPGAQLHLLHRLANERHEAGRTARRRPTGNEHGTWRDDSTATRPSPLSRELSRAAGVRRPRRLRRRDSWTSPRRRGRGSPGWALATATGGPPSRSISWSIAELVAEHDIGCRGAEAIAGSGARALVDSAAPTSTQSAPMWVTETSGPRIGGSRSSRS
ncbi:MAG: DUF222 domain-containing protein [Ilumatobacteraceae bacterium]